MNIKPGELKTRLVQYIDGTRYFYAMMKIEMTKGGWEKTTFVSSGFWADAVKDPTLEEIAICLEEVARKLREFKAE